MDSKLILILLTYLIPAASNLVCCVIAGLDILITPVQRERRLKRWLVAFFFTDFFIWINLLWQSFFPDIFFYTQQLWYFALLIDPVLMYIVIRILTPNVRNPFRLGWLLALPIAIVVISTLLSVFMPDSIPPEAIKASKGYLVNFDTKVMVELFFSIFCMVACLTRILVSRRKLPDTDDPNLLRTRRWMSIMLPFCVIVLLLPSEVIFFAQESLVRTLILFGWVLVLVTIHILCCINIIRRRTYSVPAPVPKSAPLDLSLSFLNESAVPHTTLQPEAPPVAVPAENTEAPGSEQTESPPPERCYEPLTKKLNRRSFDAWFGRNKPYLDPELTMEDLLEPLGVNRSQLSGFVNTNYGMSFVNYVSRWRLKELEKLQAMPRNRSVTLTSLLPQAGFGSHKSYRRAQEFHATFKSE